MRKEKGECVCGMGWCLVAAVLSTKANGVSLTNSTCEVNC